MDAVPPLLTLHDWASLRTEFIWAYDHAPPERSRHIEADHSDGNWAWYMRRGHVRIRCSHGEFVAHAGQWLFPPNELHWQHFSDDAHLISIKFTCRWPAGENLFAAPPPLVADGSEHPALLRTATRLVRQVGALPTDAHHSYTRQPATYPAFRRLQRAFHAWLEAWFEMRVAHGAQVARHLGDRRVLMAVRLLDETPLDTPVSRHALESCGLSLVQLTRLFRKHLRLTPHQYRERRRVMYARIRLEHERAPLKEIAYALGFSDTPHFHTWFKRHTGLTPGAYRQNHSSV